MERITMQNLNFNATIFWHEELLKAITLVNNMILEIKSPLRSGLPCNRLRIYDQETFIHSANVSLLTILIAKKIGYQGNKLEEIARGAFLHDIGKLKIPKSILKKQGKLRIDEYDIMKKHPEYGIKLIEPFSLPETVRKPIIQHHERWRGTGYPLGLKAEEIHPNAHIVAVADVLAALIEDRSYRKGLGVKQALKIIIEGKGEEFSPIVVNEVIEVFNLVSY
ncbi:HD-GYP domain-containing protein [Desulfitobacterium sp. AusDCA]|uniref:HD-GYP domain-containing protein n=1 Tax=Desulfitobacterium sp. AusDCA TaxID=3240383 RepID=UPI003DA71286